MYDFTPRLSLTLAFIFTMLVVSSCVTVGSPNDEAIIRKIDAVNKVLEDDAFRINGGVSAALLSNCQIRFTVTWSQHVSNQKGFAAVFTTVEVDFAKNVDGVLYRTAFETESEGYTQKWGAGVWLELFSDVTGEFKSQPIGGGGFEVRPYDVDFVLFGVERTHAPNKTEHLVALLNEIIHDCG